ncbi:MAG TPA: MmcQ/YjbR family DNA-binding protein [Xanthomonadales bacterium]|nr:MmcQ/YjbR family DNA-binding protein [Xanthomonadales bacterium]
MPKTIPEATRELCLAFPEAQETLSHGRPDYRVNDRSFAKLMINLHGDGRVALWLHMPPGAQEHFVELDPESYFPPPYLAKKGWLGVELNEGLSWPEVAARAREAWEHTATAGLASELESTPSVLPPDSKMSSEEIDPLQSSHAKNVLKELRKRIQRLPEVNEDTQFGRPVWKAGKKTFVGVFHRDGHLQLDFWVGIEQQVMMTMDPRFTVPKFTGHNGWINMDVEEFQDWNEIDDLIENSYRHFALKRMLSELDGK